MKKSLLALAVLGAFAGAAQAQSSVTIYGSFDAGVRYKSHVNAAGDSVWTMGSTGTYNSNRLGFKGVEDLGGGMNAHFTLETGFNSGTGALDAANTIFNRTAAVGLGGAWGSVDLGRQYTVPFKTIAAYDPFAYKYPGLTAAVPASDGTRYNNDIQYTGTFGAITARAEYALGEVAGSTNTGSAKSIGGGYADGPLAVGASYTRKDVAGVSDDHYTLGGKYQFGAARVYLGYANEKLNTAVNDTKTQYTWGGVGFAVSPVVDLIGAYYQTKNSGLTSGKKDFFIVSATYALSKRTNFYADIDSAKLDGIQKTVGQDRQTGVSVGINHLF